MPTHLRLTGALAAAVMTAAIAFVAPGSALAATCDNTFTGPSGERWNTAANWTAAANPTDHHIPTTTENVCIPLGKRVIVNEPGIANAADVTIDEGAAVEILSEAGFGDSQASWANVANAGLIEFTASGAGNGQLRIGNGKVLTNTGTIRANQTGGGTSYILGDLANTAGGTVEVKTPLVAQSAGGIPLLWTNAGQFTVDAGTSFKTSSQQPIEYRQTGGTTTVNGLFELLGASDRLAATGGAFDGSSTPLIHNGDLALTGGTGTVRSSFGTPSLAADVGAGWTIRIEDRGSGATTLRIPAGAQRTNAGTIRYAVDPTATDSRVVTSITVGTGGELINTGTIVSDAALTQRTELAGNFTNAAGGTLTVNKQLYVSASGVGVLVVWNNAGTITVADSGSIWDNTYRWTLSQTGGTLTANGPVDIGPAVATRFVVSGGTVDGTRPPRLRSGTIELTGGTGTVRVQGGLAALGTDVPAGWTVRVEDRGRLTVPAGAQRTNAGTIRFRHDPEFTIGGEVPSLEIAADGRLTNTGAIIAEPTTNFTVAIKALKLDANSLADPTAFVQNGVLDLQHPEVTLPPFTQNAGTTTIPAGTRAQVGTPSNANDPGVTLAGGTLTGSGRLWTRSLKNTGGTFAPVSGGATPFEVSYGVFGTDPANVDGGDYTQGPGGTLRVRVAATGTGVTVGGKIRLAGTVDLAPSAGFTPPAGQTYQVLRIKNIRDNTAARSGTFGTVVGTLTPTYELDGVDTTAPYPPGASSFSVADESTFENTTFTFTVKRSAPATGSATVHWALRKNGSADPLTGDYPIGPQAFPFQGDLSFADGETEKTVTTVWAGTAGGPEPDETFQFHLSHPTNIPISRATATATIFNRDPQLDAVTPNTLGNAGPTTVRLVGAGLSSRTVVRLQRSGRPDLEPVPGSFQAAEDGKSAVVTFDTTGATPLDGNWFLRATLPGGAPTRPITLQASTGGAQPWAQLAGPSSLRGGLPSTSTLLWGNTGDAASPPGLLHLTGYPYGAEITVTGATGSTKPQVIDGGTGRSLVLAVGAIPARSVNSIQIRYLPSTTIAGHTILELQPLLTFSTGPIPPLTGQTITGATDRTPGPGELFSTDLTLSGGATARMTYSQEAATDPVSKPGITREGNTWIFRGTPQTQDEAPRSFGDGKVDLPYSQGLLKVDLSGEQIQITGDVIEVESAYELRIDRLRLTECLKAKNWITQEDYENLKRLADGALTMKLATTAGGFSKAIQNYAPALGALDSITSGAWEEYVVGSRFSFWGSGGVLNTIGDPNNPFLGRDRRERMLILLQRCSDPIRPPVQPAPQRQEIFQSNDPNDKLGTTGGGDARAIRSDTRLAYTVRFQNKPDASAAAQIVVVDDQLDPAKVDLGSASLGPITVGGDLVLTPPTGATSWTTIKDLRPANDLLLKVEATLNTSTGAARWTFTSLDPVTLAATTDALAGFLPPDSSPPAGQGSVSYLALPKTGIASGTTIGGDAAIKFDNNDVLRTNVWSNLIDDDAPTSAVSSVSPTACNKLDVKWSGSDAASGIESYDVFVSIDGGAFEPWLTRTTGTSATYQGAAGRTYAFDVQARDFATNLQGDGRSDAVSGTPTCPDPPTPPVAPGDGGTQVPLGGSAPPNTSPVIVAAPKPWVTFGKLATSLKKNRFELKVTCVQAELAGCAGNVTLTTSVKKGKKTKLTTLGSAKFSKLKAGKTITVKVKISKKGLALLRSGARSVTITAKPSVKSDPRTTTATAKLKKLRR